MSSFFTYLRNVRTELSHVVWPTQRQAIGHVGIILLISAFVALFTAALDYAFTEGVARFFIR